MLDKRNPYANNAAAAYVTAINILAVEYLIKTKNEAKYSRLCEKVYKLDLGDLESLFILLDLNMHTSSLGAMITQGDYDYQKQILLEFLGEKRETTSFNVKIDRIRLEEEIRYRIGLPRKEQ